LADSLFGIIHDRKEAFRVMLDRSAHHDDGVAEAARAAFNEP